MLHLAEQTAAGFLAAFGSTPEGVWQSPGRVNLIGEHTDYNGGFVLPIAINRATCAAVSRRSDGIVRVGTTFSEQIIELPTSELGTASGWSSYPLGVALVLGAKTGCDIFIDSDVPVGAGLSSSAAIEAAVALALNELWQLGHTREALARFCQQAENEVVGAPTGIMDQSASLLGKADHAVFLDCRSLEAKAIKLGFEERGLELVIIDTRVAHRLVDGGYASRRAACELGARTLGVETLRELEVGDLECAEELLDNETFRRVRHVVTENARVLEFISKLDDDAALGRLMHDSHVSMRDDFEISVDELDTAVETAVRHGAVGARMTGGGFGGSAIAIVPVGKISELTNSVYAEFELLGYERPNIFTVSAADCGSRLL
ncbi:MAG: galactokinase [Rhodoluna sp.]|nr:galactokinase [Rhodoluna sp.]